VHVHFLFPQAVDGLSGGAATVPLWGVAALTPATLLVGYGLARGGSALCNGASHPRHALLGPTRLMASSPIALFQSCATRFLPK
jgi:hypothetical protein